MLVLGARVVSVLLVLLKNGGTGAEEGVSDGGKGAAPGREEAGRPPRNLSLGLVVMAAEAWLGYRVLCVSGSGSGLCEAKLEAPILLASSDGASVGKELRYGWPRRWKH